MKGRKGKIMEGRGEEGEGRREAKGEGEGKEGTRERSRGYSPPNLELCPRPCQRL
jgi:hypothetical protein